MSYHIYKVGGSVRDALLGLPVSDIDYVVVGATPQQMVEAGYKPVGKDFPVFLHPTSHAEYALARTERKVGQGYRGFVVHADPSVTLEEDLQRRDLTINAMAQDEHGRLIDPFGGQSDLERRLFRHVSDAFIEDPVRILRLARFAARFAQFTVAPETLSLMQQMVANGEVDALVPERVWQELARGLQLERPSRMLQVLQDCGALVRVLALNTVTADVLLQVQQLVDVAVVHDKLEVSYAVFAQLAALTYEIDKADGIQKLNQQLRIPRACAQCALQLQAVGDQVSQAHTMRQAQLLELLMRCDALRNPQPFMDVLLACEVKFAAGSTAGDTIKRSTQRLRDALAVVTQVPTAAIAQQHAGDIEKLKAAIAQARLQTLVEHGV